MALLASTTPSAANLRAYAEIVREKSVMRQSIDAFTNGVNVCFDPEGKDAAEILTAAQASLAVLASQSLATHGFKAADLAKLMAGAPTPPKFIIALYLPRGVVFRGTCRGHRTGVAFCRTAWPCGSRRR